MSAGPRGTVAVVLSSLVMLALAGPAAAGPDPKAQIVPLGMSIANAPNPVLGADGRNHLAYEITIVNQTQGEVTIESVQARSRGRAIGARLQGPSLEALLRVNSGGTIIPSGGSALLFMDVQYSRNAPRPTRLTHGFTMSFSQPPDPVQNISFVGVPTAVGKSRAIEVGRPLKGPRWVAATGCCHPINAHRAATLSIDGTVRVPERFAIDWVQLAPSGRLFEGPINELSSYAYFGEPIYSVAQGRVVGIQDDMLEQIPGSLPTGQTVQTAGGNYVVVKLAAKRFAFYAHMQPGSLRVEVGDRVRRGQVLGLLGNTGNTDGPHLHFHIMDGPSPLQSNGLPFVHPRFTGQGLADETLLESGDVVPINTQVLSGTFRSRMPMGFQVVDFGN
jgi:hypothetical protein